MSSLSFKRLCVAACFIVIIAGSSVPGGKIPDVFQMTPDKLLHCVEYFVFGLFIVRWIDGEMPNMSIFRLLWVSVLAGGLFAMTDELYQHLTPNRTPDFYDWCLDVIGITMSSVLFAKIRKK